MTFDDYCKATGHYAEAGDRVMWEAAIKAEREACAKVCERIGGKMTDDCDGAQPGFWPDQVAHRCATEIMVRSNVEFSGGAPLHGAASAGT